MQTYCSESEQETVEIAMAIARKLKPGSVLALSGELGAGKTCFVQGLASGLDVVDVVNSPTFTLVNEYRGRIPLYHMDFYRIDDDEEALALGLDEYMYGKGVTAIEWSEKIDRLLPAHAMRVHIECGDGMQQRVISVRGAQV